MSLQTIQHQPTSALARSYKMDKVTFIEVADPFTGDIVEHAIIDHGNDQFTSMLKSTYDEQQAEQSTPIVTDAD